MQPDTAAPSSVADTEEALTKLSASARGWHTIQLAPRSVQVIGAVLAVIALAVACASVFTVGRVAWPLFEQTHLPAQQRLARAGAALNSGVRLTVVALILIVVATLIGWWPGSAAASDPTQTSGGAARMWTGHVV